MLRFDTFFDELVKLGEAEEGTARQLLDRLAVLEHSYPTPAQILRAGGIGAVAAPMISVTGDLVAGRPPFKATGTLLSKQVARNAAGDAAKGFVAGTLVRPTQALLDRYAEIGRLQDALEEAKEQKAAGVGQGAPMTVSPYSGPLSRGAFPLVSGLPNRAPPSLHGVVEKKGELAKAAGLYPKGRTPAQRFRSARQVGTSLHNVPPGPSVAQIVGGPPTPGAEKATEGLSKGVS